MIPHTLFNWIETIESNPLIPWPKPPEELFEDFCQAYPEVRAHIQAFPDTPLEEASITLPPHYALAYELWQLESGLVPLRAAVANAILLTTWHRQDPNRRVYICDAKPFRALHPPLTLYRPAQEN